jgi:hypothetical protein
VNKYSHSTKTGTFARSSKAAYSHVVVVEEPNGEENVWHWAGSAELAAKQAATLNNKAAKAGSAYRARVEAVQA